MPRQLNPHDTLDTLEEDVIFTNAMLQADEDAADLVPETESWLAQIDVSRGADRLFRQHVVCVDAARISANLWLDMAVTSFADDLLLDCNKDRESIRWKGFFPQAPSLFVKQPLADETAAVKSWLEAATDPSLDLHREALTKRAENASSALSATRNVSVKRAANLQQREGLAQQLTAARDVLHGTRVKRAQERKLPRDWPDAFFRVEPSKASKASTADAGVPAEDTAG